MLKSEGGFIHAGNNFWHKRCFNCSGCGKNVAESPMVDLLGQPSCVDCFDGCLKRGPTTPKKGSPAVTRVDKVGGFSPQSREKSPTIEELEQRLGISKQEGSPAFEQLNKRLGAGSESKRPFSGSPTGANRVKTSARELSPPSERSRTKVRSLLGENSIRAFSPGKENIMGCHTPTQDAVEEMKQRFLKDSPRTSGQRIPASSCSPTASPSTNLLSSRSSSSLRHRLSPSPVQPVLLASPSVPQTPDLVSDFSDTTTQSSTSPSGLSSPLRDDDSLDRSFISGYDRLSQLGQHEKFSIEGKGATFSPKSPPTQNTSPSSQDTTGHTCSLPSSPTSSKSTKTTDVLAPVTETRHPPSDAVCVQCGKNLFSIRGEGKFVNIPNQARQSVLSYHADCFKCAKCQFPFKEGTQGQAVFVNSEDGPCHVEVCVAVAHALSR